MGFKLTVRNFLAPVTLVSALLPNSGCRTAYEQATTQQIKLNDDLVDYELGASLTDVVDKQFGDLHGKKIDFKKVRALNNQPEIPQVWQDLLLQPIREENSQKKPHEEKLPEKVEFAAYMAAFDGKLTEAFKENKISKEAYDAFVEFKEHISDLEKVLKGMGIQRYVLSIAQDNLNSDLHVFNFGRLEGANADYRAQVAEIIRDFDKSARDLTFEEQQLLEQAFSAGTFDDDLVQGYKAMSVFNKDGMQAVRQAIVMARSLSAIEAQYGARHQLHNYANNILKCQTGIDEQKQGRFVLDAILNKLKIGDIARKDSQLSERFTPETPLRKAYEQLLAEVQDAASTPAWHTRDDIAQGPGYLLMNILAQTYASGFLKTPNTEGKHLFVAARGAVLEDIVTAARDSSLEGSVNGWKIFASIVVPLYGAINAGANADWALRSNWYDPETEDGRLAIIKSVRAGASRENGLENYPWVVGDNTPARVQFYTGAGATVVQIAGAIAGIAYAATIEPTSRTTTTPAPTGGAPLGGGGGTGPQTG